jgi:hypothetical protein
MARSITSNKAKVNVQKVKEVLGRYELADIDIMIDDQGYLRVDAGQPSDEPWPKAVLMTDLPNTDDFATDDGYFDAFVDALMEKGHDGFRSLLRELSSCIETPLVILAISVDADGAGDGHACVWRIEPGSTDVDELIVYEELWDSEEEVDPKDVVTNGSTPQLAPLGPN